MAAKSCVFRIWRFDPADGREAHYQEYSLDVPDGMTVLEALLRIQEEQDGTLAFRYACRGAVCGSCAMLINGREDLACRTQVHGVLAAMRTGYSGETRKKVELPAETTPVITLEPLRNLRTLKDLVVDMEPFFEHLEAVQPWLQPADPEPEKERLVAPAEWAEAEPYTNCVLCSCCVSVCPAAAEDPAYLGPAALAQHYRFYADARDAAGEGRLDLVNGSQGVGGCDMVWNCVEICPKGVTPTRGIGKTRAAIRKAERAANEGEANA
jgi:succinate dehydrogenase / fumarate reductase, iron-sulfur subunit